MIHCCQFVCQVVDITKARVESKPTSWGKRVSSIASTVGIWLVITYLHIRQMYSQKYLAHSILLSNFSTDDPWPITDHIVGNFYANGRIDDLSTGIIVP